MTRWQSLAAILALAALPAGAETRFQAVQTQFIAALGQPGESAGSNAADWGIWVDDPGPRGVWLQSYPELAANDGLAPAGWTFDPAEWWMEEFGRIMEKPEFPLPPGQYLVTGGREVTAVLTISQPGADGVLNWALSDGATLGDVTHLACRSAVYRAQDGQTCTPEQARASFFPVRPGEAMPPVEGCVKQDYAVLFIVGVAEGS